jgi:hypothetical protein
VHRDLVLEESPLVSRQPAVEEQNRLAVALQAKRINRGDDAREIPCVADEIERAPEWRARAFAVDGISRQPRGLTVPWNPPTRK